MQVKLVFNLPEEFSDLMVALRAPDYSRVLENVLNTLRSTRKHTNQKTIKIETVEQMIYVELQNNGCQLYGDY